MPLAKFRCPLCGYETEQAAGAKDVSHSCKSRGYRQVYLDRVEPELHDDTIPGQVSRGLRWPSPRR